MQPKGCQEMGPNGSPAGQHHTIHPRLFQRPGEIKSTPLGWFIDLTHESVRDFLIGEGRASFWLALDKSSSPEEASHGRLAQCCMSYINAYAKLTANVNTVPNDLRYPATTAALRLSVETKYPLLEYCAQNIFYHAEKADIGTQHALLLNFPRTNWEKAHNMLGNYRLWHGLGTSLLYILAAYDSQL